MTDNQNLFNQVIAEILKSTDYMINQSVKKTTKIYDGVIVSANANGTYNIRFNNETRAVRQYGEGIPQVGQVVKVYIPQGNANLSYFALASEGSGESPILMIPIANATTVGGIKANPKATTDTQAVKIDNDGFLWTAPSTSTETENRLNQLEEDVNGLEANVGNLGDKIDGLNAVQYTAQTLTDSQKTQARANIGAGTSSFSGAFGDLSGKPTTLAGYGITDAQPAITSANKLSATLVSGLATVATSGSYNDLTDKPSIPSAVTVDSALSTTSTNPVRNSVVTSALNDKYSSSNPPPYPVTSVNGQTGAVTIEEYTLPIANATTLGGVKIGDGLTITSTGVLSTTGVSSQVPWSGITGKPDTIVGYGITDAFVNTSTKTVSIGGNTLSDLVSDADYVHTDNNFTTAEKNKLSGITAGAQVNVIESISINGTAQTITDKGVNISVPTNNNQLTNGAGYITSAQAPVQSVNGQTGIVSLGAADVGAQATITGGATTITTSNLTANRALISDGNGKVAVSIVTSTELGYLDGVTSAIQTQLNGKAPLDSPALIGVPTAPTAAIGTNTTQIATTAFVVNAVADATGGGYSETNPPPYPVTSVNGQTGDVTVSVELPEHLVKYDTLGPIETTSSINADTLQGHTASYFATKADVSALSVIVDGNTNDITANTQNISTNTQNIAALQSNVNGLQSNINGKVSKSGDTMTGALVAQNNIDYGVAQVRNIIISTSDPSGGNSGDIWIRYTP